MKTKRFKAICIFLLFIIFQAKGQDIENIIRSKPFQFSGELYLSGDTYNAFGSDPLRRSPYSYSIVGSPVFTLYGVTLPFSFAFSDQQYSFSQPFNVYGLSPSYKWATVHLGYRSMNFSSFTLSGKQFYGAGAELNPGKWRIGALYGKLKDLYAQKDSLTFGSQFLDTYDRMINGVKLGYGTRNSIDFSYIKVKDRENSGMVQEADNTLLFPEDNLVLGINANAYLFKYVNLFLETAASLHTSNQQADIQIEDESLQQLVRSVDKLIEVNASTRWGFAGKTGMQFNYRNMGIGFSYFRVDPYFKSLGLYYMNTDYEIYSANSTLSLLKNALRINITGGYQQNNISRLKQQTDLRKIGSVNLSYFNPRGFTMILNYSNYQTDQSAGYIQIEDSIKLALVNEMALFAPSYSWQKNKNSHSVSLNFSYQKFIDVNKYRTVNLINDYNYNASADYSWTIQPQNLSLNIGSNYFLLISDGNNNTQVGISLGANQYYLKKKLNARISLSWNQNYYNQTADGHTMNIRVRSSFKVMKNQNLSLNMYWLNRTGIHQRNVNELRSSLNYSLSF